MIKTRLIAVLCLIAAPSLYGLDMGKEFSTELRPTTLEMHRFLAKSKDKKSKKEKKKAKKKDKSHHKRERHKAKAEYAPKHKVPMDERA